MDPADTGIVLTQAGAQHTGVCWVEKAAVPTGAALLVREDALC